MNFNLTNIPVRTTSPRLSGLTIISDKGLALKEVENLLSVAAPYIDMVKLAFGTAVVTPYLNEKIELFHSYKIPVYFGGLLFEAFVIRNQLKDYIELVNKFDITVVEISDGAIDLSHEQKCEYIHQFCQLGKKVISEIGSKDKDKKQVTPPYKWIQMIQAELEAGSDYIVAEAKETGTDGIYRDSGEVREGLIEEILTKVDPAKIIWETPLKDQQLYFIERLGCNANLGNIPAAGIIALEAMRVGLRSDSFDFYLNK